MGSVARGAWRRLGALPAIVAVGALYALGAAALLLGDAGGAVGIALLAVFVLYCLARPANGWDVLAWAQLPNVGLIAHEAIGTPRWIAYALVPVALLVELGVDAPPAEDDEAGAPSAAGRPG